MAFSGGWSRRKRRRIFRSFDVYPIPEVAATNCPLALSAGSGGLRRLAACVGCGLRRLHAAGGNAVGACVVEEARADYTESSRPDLTSPQAPENLSFLETRMDRRRNLLKLFTFGLWGGAVLLAGCQADPTSPASGPAPVAKATVEVLNLYTTDPYADYDGACQTNGLMEFRAWDGTGESGLAGEPVLLEWSFQVDRGRGLEPSPDWGGQSVFVDRDTDKPMHERTIVLNMLTIGFHQATLTVRTRDGRQSTTTLDLLVTSCEDCGT
jgi:hypothetical protein